MSRRPNKECRRQNCHQRIDRAGLCCKHYRASKDRGYVDAAAVQAHINALHAAGMTYAAISYEAAMTPYGLNLVLGRDKVQKGTAQRILRIPIGGGGGYVPALGTQRRLQALAAIGWTFEDVAARTGETAKRLSQIMQSRRVRVETARRVSAAFDELCTTTGPSVVNRRRARQYGWAPPLAWDDATIDDPKAKPQHQVRRAVSFAERYVEVRDHCGITELTAVAEKLGQLPESVARQIERRRDDINRLEGIAS